MTNKEKLTDRQVLLAAIEVATNRFGVGYNASRQLIALDCLNEKGLALEDYYWFSKDAIIFDQNFAKAFWGETVMVWEGEDDGKVCFDCGSNTFVEKIVEYKLRLQQLALAEDRMEYLKRFIK